MTVKAKDEDTGDNGRVTYHFKVNNENVQETEDFRIDEVAGEIQAKGILDREVKSNYQVNELVWQFSWFWNFSHLQQ